MSILTIEPMATRPYGLNEVQFPMAQIARIWIGTLLVLAMLNMGYASEEGNCRPSAPPHNEAQWDFFADVLVWNLQETCTQWAFIINPIFAQSLTLPFSGRFEDVLQAVTFDWNAGIRTGFSYTLEHDCWDTRLYYTWYHTSGSNHVIPFGGDLIQSQFVGTDFLLSLPGLSPSFKEAKIKWNVLFNMFNWDLGKVCWVGDFLSLRPYLGLQGGWIHQNIHVHWMNSNTLFSYNAPETLKHHFWGLGPEAGINSKWNLGSIANHAFSLYGDFAQIFMWGHWSFDEVAQTTIGFVTINTQPDRNMGSLTFQGAAGFVWDACFNNKSLFTLKLGYELQIWIQQLQFFQHFSGILDNALILQGATCRFVIQF